MISSYPEVRWFAHQNQETQIGRRVFSILMCLILANYWMGRAEAQDTGLIFDHQKHKQVLCATCHQLEDPTEPKRVPEQVCSLCHQVGDHANPDAGCGMCHARADHVVGSLPRPTYADLNFSHKPHLAAKLPCLSCHKNQDQAKNYRQIHFPEMTECVDCHTKRDVSTDCQTCHKYWRPEVIPDFHDDHWLHQHGRFAREQFEQKCTFCHSKKSFCQDCHMADPPPSHTAFFRNRGHGAMARADRKMCQACHQQDACLECHDPENGVRPASHLPGYARPPYLHCTQCHFPAGQANGCSACHSASRISERHQDAAGRLLTDSSRDFVSGLIGADQRNCLSACHRYDTRPPPHPLGLLNNADCLRCHIAE